MKTILLILSIVISFNSWSASAKRSPTPQYLPAGICDFKTKSLAIPGTDFRISRFEVFTSRRGPNPSIQTVLKFKKNDKYIDAGQLIFQMPEMLELDWIADQLGNPEEIYETTRRRNVDLMGQSFDVVAKRQIKNLNVNKIVTEILFYSANEQGDLSLALQASCESDITAY